MELDLTTGSISREIGPIHAVKKNGVDTFQYEVVVSREISRARRRSAEVRPPYLTVTLPRDGTFEGRRRIVYVQFRLTAYRRWLDAAIRQTRETHGADRRLLFINAWNGWSEGLFVEPDSKHGFARLNETSRALLDLSSSLKMPKISVIVPNYNHAPFLRQRLNSIYRQTYTNIEVILMDDFSTDESRAILNEFAGRYPDITTTVYN